LCEKFLYERLSFELRSDTRIGKFLTGFTGLMGFDRPSTDVDRIPILGRKAALTAGQAALITAF
jgi:hypothetical protein